MSTFNGEQFLHQQIESILGQKDVSVRIVIRDDGSLDNSVNIIEKFSLTNPNIHLIKGNNVGCIKSFLALLDVAWEYKAEYYAFSDQDDVWLPNKLISAISQLKSYADTPTLYCSNLDIVDSNLHFIGRMYSSSTRPIRNMALLKNIATGCTCVFNKKLLQLYYDLPKPNYVVMHDWWLYCLAAFFGNVIFDENSYIQYRQHSTNVLGAKNTNYLQKLSNLVKSFFNCEREHYRSDQAIEFLRITRKYLKEEDLYNICKIAYYNKSLKARIKFAANTKIISVVNFRLRIRIILGLI